MRREIGQGALLRQVFDMIVVALLMALTGGPESPYFMFFPFVLISGVLFWRWRGALLTSLAAFGILVVLVRRERTGWRYRATAGMTAVKTLGNGTGRVDIAMPSASAMARTSCARVTTSTSLIILMPNRAGC